MSLCRWLLLMVIAVVIVLTLLWAAASSSTAYMLTTRSTSTSSTTSNSATSSTTAIVTTPALLPASHVDDKPATAAHLAKTSGGDCTCRKFRSRGSASLKARSVARCLYDPPPHLRVRRLPLGELYQQCRCDFWCGRLFSSNEDEVVVASSNLLHQSNGGSAHSTTTMTKPLVVCFMYGIHGGATNQIAGHVDSWTEALVIGATHIQMPRVALSRPLGFDGTGRYRSWSEIPALSLLDEPVLRSFAASLGIALVAECPDSSPSLPPATNKKSINNFPSPKSISSSPAAIESPPLSTPLLIRQRTAKTTNTTTMIALGNTLGCTMDQLPDILLHEIHMLRQQQQHIHRQENKQLDNHDNDEVVSTTVIHASGGWMMYAQKDPTIPTGLGNYWKRPCALKRKRVATAAAAGRQLLDVEQFAQGVYHLVMEFIRPVAMLHPPLPGLQDMYTTRGFEIDIKPSPSGGSPNQIFSQNGVAESRWLPTTSTTSAAESNNGSMIPVAGSNPNSHHDMNNTDSTAVAATVSSRVGVYVSYLRSLIGSDTLQQGAYGVFHFRSEPDGHNLASKPVTQLKRFKAIKRLYDDEGRTGYSRGKKRGTNRQQRDQQHHQQRKEVIQTWYVASGYFNTINGSLPPDEAHEVQSLLDELSADGSVVYAPFNSTLRVALLQAFENQTEVLAAAELATALRARAIIGEGGSSFAAYAAIYHEAHHRRMSVMFHKRHRLVLHYYNAILHLPASPKRLQGLEPTAELLSKICDPTQRHMNLNKCITSL